MIIGSSTMSMASSRKYAAEQKEISKVKIGNEVNVNQTTFTKKESSFYFKDVMKSEMNDEVSGDMEKSMLGMKPGNSSNISSDTNSISRENSRKIREQTIMFLIRFLYNKLWRNHGEQIDLANYNSSGEITSESVIGQNEYYSSYEESEETDFSTTGTVVTKDGREIKFNVDMKMSRSFKEAYYSKQDIKAKGIANMVDPLVINLNNNVANVSDQKFYFDLDQDGIKENISSLSSGSGFLAIDLNGDGIINDGSELFGTKSGDGFLDLSKYDEDGNGWIDEADSVFSKLLIWTKDENGKDELYHLKDKGVGALCLERAETDFSIKSLKDNLTNARVRQTGVFLYENGQVGTLQQMDLAT